MDRTHYPVSKALSLALASPLYSDWSGQFCSVTIFKAMLIAGMVAGLDLGLCLTEHVVQPLKLQLHHCRGALPGLAPQVFKGTRRETPRRIRELFGKVSGLGFVGAS